MILLFFPINDHSFDSWCDAGCPDISFGDEGIKVSSLRCSDLRADDTLGRSPRPLPRPRPPVPLPTSIIVLDTVMYTAVYVEYGKVGTVILGPLSHVGKRVLDLQL